MHAHHRVSFESVCAYIRIYCYSISPRRYIYVYTRTLTTLALFFYTHCIFIRTDRCTSHNPRRDAVRRRGAHGRAAATAPGAETMKKEQQQQRCRRSTATSGCLSLSLASFPLSLSSPTRASLLHRRLSCRRQHSPYSCSWCPTLFLLLLTFYTRVYSVRYPSFVSFGALGFLVPRKTRTAVRVAISSGGVHGP